MSGICGIVVPDDRLGPRHLLPMVRASDISGEGEASIAHWGSVGLGVQKSVRSMAGISEISIGQRPLAIAFHGSLYNLHELFSSSAAADSDPAGTLLHLYRQEGPAFLQRLRGDFALALWDGLTETLYLATDRFRIYPLFYYEHHGQFVYSSRITGILACPWPLKRTVNPEAIVDVVASSIIPTPKTIFREVKKLPPGYTLTYHNGEIRLSRYWDISFVDYDLGAKEILAKRLRGHFEDAVVARVKGEQSIDRIGSFLSGGVDSTTMTGVLTKVVKRPIKGFSIGFSEQRFNEIEYARLAAQALGVKHYEYFVTPQDLYNAIPVLLEAFDEPFANASAIPTYFCARLAQQQGVDVLYAGDGGDELFGGNERYATQRLFDYYHRIPAWLRTLLVEPVVSALSDRLKWEVFVKGRKYIQRARIPYPERLSSYGLFKLIPMEEMLDDGLLAAVGSDYDPSAPIRSYYSQAPARCELDRQLYIDLKLAIGDNDLLKVTRMAEAARVTVRFPFLDHHLAEFAATIPAKIKMRGTRLRSFFKETYADLLPLATRTKKKHGFGLPIALWLRTDPRLREMMHDLVLSPRSLHRGYFRKTALEKLVNSHESDNTSFYGTVLWNLMVLELWHRTHLN